MATTISFLEPWTAITPASRDAFEKELRREVPPGHVLYGRTVRAVARRHDRDDALFEFIDSGECAMVHLTWSTRTERPSYPKTQMYESISSWASTAMLRDRDEFEGDQ